MISHCFKLHRSYSMSFNLSKCLRNFLGLQKEKESFCVGYSIKWASEIRKFHVAVLQRRLSILQKSVMYVQSCSFANVNLLLFCRARCRHRCRCLSPPLLWSRSFAAMVTWRHTSPLRLRPFLTQHSWLNLTLFLQLACGLNHGILQ